ncbi:hypothetical protein BsIDN1_01510 [Bacillus safensis]|uniref:Glutamine amidotransferase domain-containing protein n=1 Tax=Bacillus safensis TaxID=561879 RepID=A0A5S9M081_BACIA|nr:hypothetical protein BsIDN1_01510 [Bacillus safensis]
MILMIDNYDSFTYNLVQYLGELGEELIVKRNDQVTIQEIEELKPDFLMISPGPCSPDEAGISMEAIKHFAGSIPIFGVCLGHQSIAQVFGGDVVRAERLMHGKTSEIKHDGKGVFTGLQNPLVATRYHSLIVKKTRRCQSALTQQPAQRKASSWLFVIKNCRLKVCNSILNRL